MEGGVELDQLAAEPSGKLILKDFQNNISVKDLEFVYPNKQEAALKINNLHIPKGEKIGLVGRSGAGKSTLVNLLIRFYDTSQGDITFDDLNLKDIDVCSLRENISIIPQDTALFHRSLMENIRYGRPNATDEDVFEAARKAHADEFIMQLPEKYDTLVGERGVN